MAAAALSEEEQDALADLIESFMTEPSEATFTAEEVEEIKRLGAQPFVETDPAEVEAFFARYRQRQALAARS